MKFKPNILSDVAHSISKASPVLLEIPSQK